MALELSDLKGQDVSDLTRLSELLDRMKALKIKMTRSDINRIMTSHAYLKWEMFRIILSKGITLRQIEPWIPIQMGVLKIAIDHQMPADLLLQFFDPMPQGKLALSGFTPLHLVVNSTYPAVQKRLIIRKMLNSSKWPLYAQDAANRSCIGYCKEQSLKTLLQDLVTSMTMLWVWGKAKNRAIRRIPYSLYRVIISDYI